MRCPLCGTRRAKRLCPALGKEICPVCCGTSRLVEIACPPTCGYLATAAVHPPAVAKRQQERDLALMMPAIDGLSESQGQLMSLVLALAVRHGSAGLGSARDAELIDGLSATQATLETAGRGVIYQHRPATLPGQRLATDLATMIQDLAAKAGRSLDAEAAAVLGRVTRLAEAARKTSPASETAFLEFVKRIVRTSERDGGAGQSAERPAIIVP